jgi:hypothetical protein
LERFYGELRRCRKRCGGRPAIEHRVDGKHDCAASACVPHVCKPFSASTVRQMHSISGACTAAERWGWISSNPGRVALRPRAEGARARSAVTDRRRTPARCGVRAR